MSAAPTTLALDHNFPEPILNALETFMVDSRLVPIRRIDQRLPDLDDRQLVIALHQLGYQGLVTNNYKMLKNPTELVASSPPSARQLAWISPAAISTSSPASAASTHGAPPEKTATVTASDKRTTNRLWAERRSPQQSGLYVSV